MTRARTLLTGAAAIGVGATVWGAASPALPHTRVQIPSRGRDRAYNSEFDRGNLTDPVERGGGGSADISALVAWMVGGAVVLALAALAAYLLLLATRALLERWRHRQAPPSSEGQVEVTSLPAAVLERAPEHRRRLAAGTPREGIVAAWEGLEESVQGTGVPLPESRTSTETTTEVLARYAVDPGALDTLARLYREARWSRRDLDETDRRAAESALAAVEADLRRLVPEHASVGSDPVRGRR